MDGNILILDYSDFDREKIKYLLKRIGEFNILIISSIDEYYLLMDNIKDITLMIMDIAFPNETEGFEILSSLKKGPCKNVPVIIVSRSEKLEYRDKAVKLGVSDYIIKPYSSNRLESSIRNFVRVENKFDYGTKDIEDISVSFDQFIQKELYMAEAVKQSISIIVIAATGTNDNTLLQDAKFMKRRELACDTAINTIKPMLSIPDVVVSNNNREILIVLPLTDASYGKLCKEKVVENISVELEKIGEKYTDHFYSVCVTYPDEGKDFQTLMKCAFNKITDKDLYDKVGMITQDTKKYANKMYNKYTKWF